MAVGENDAESRDRTDMDRMGKRQELRRTFKLMSIIGYAVILGNTWEFVLVTMEIPLNNGGTAGGFWMFLAVCCGMFFVVLSMAEMASMAPTSGGQYHWVSEIAPRKYQKFLSYLVGWLCVTGWQAAMATTAFATAQQLQGLIVLNSPSYVIKGWHSSLLTIGITAFAIFWNIVCVRKLPLIEGIGFALHVAGFFAFIVVLWIMGPQSNIKTVLTNFEDRSGWGSNGLSTLIGMLGPVVTLIGSDASCHLSEELKDAARVLPKAMVFTSFINYSLGIVMTFTVMSMLGDDIPGILTTPLGQPWIQVLLNATESKVYTSILTAVVCLLLLFCAINQVTTSSRQLFAFARDKGLPFSDFLADVRPGGGIPRNAVIMTQVFASLLSLIIIGSRFAFNVITSLGQVALISSYLIAIGCNFLKRLRKEPLLPSRFNLGKAGIAVNGIALLFLTVAFVLCFFPSGPKPTPEGMNWSCVIFGVILIFSVLYYHFYGRNTYMGPVEYVKKQ
ncbi:amino acid/polyamine transporter I [Alternaria alternata]|nr:amino acid/polyamine transporter I [Alternaria alternata]